MSVGVGSASVGVGTVIAGVCSVVEVPSVKTLLDQMISLDCTAFLSGCFLSVLAGGRRQIIQRFLQVRLVEKHDRQH